MSLLATASERLEQGHFGDQPATLAELHSTLGRSYLGLGNYAQGQRHWERAVAILEETLFDERESLAEALEGLASSYELQNYYPEAEDCYRRANRIWTEIGQAERVASTVWPHGLASVLYFTGRYDEAARWF